VLTGLGDRPPSEIMELLKSDAERKQVILAHASWDQQKAPHTSEWQAMALPEK
jgi:hypothetical protein